MIHPLFIGTTELLLVSGIALLMFGGKKLPEMMKGLGQGVQNFKKGMNEPISDEEMPKKVRSIDGEVVQKQPEQKSDENVEQK